MAPHLPPGLLSMILEHVIASVLWKDKRTLAACALVSRSWLDQARRYFCASIQLDSEDDLDRLIEQLDAVPPFMRDYVRDLALWERVRYCDPSWVDRVVIGLANMFPRLNRLTVHSNRVPFQLSRSLTDISASSVTSIALSQLMFPSFSDLLHLLNFFPSLSLLQCFKVKWVSAINVSLQDAAFTLAKMVLKECPHFAEAMWLFKNPPSMTISNPRSSLSSEDVMTLGKLATKTMRVTPVLLARDKSPASNNECSTLVWGPDDFGMIIRLMCLPNPKHPDNRLTIQEVWIHIHGQCLGYYSWEEIDRLLSNLTDSRDLHVFLNITSGSHISIPLGQSLAPETVVSRMEYMRHKIQVLSNASSAGKS